MRADGDEGIGEEMTRRELLQRGLIGLAALPTFSLLRGPSRPAPLPVVEPEAATVPVYACARWRGDPGMSMMLAVHDEDGRVYVLGEEKATGEWQLSHFTRNLPKDRNYTGPMEIRAEGGSPMLFESCGYQYER